MLAECEAAQGQRPAALAHVDEALRFAEEQNDLMCLSGVLLQRGTLTLAKDPGALDLAESDFRRAIDVAQGQKAKTEEASAALELARVLQKKGHPREAQERLSAATAWFQEGFDTRPVREARALLADLARPA